MSEQAWRAVSRSSIGAELPQIMETSTGELFEQVNTFWQTTYGSPAWVKPDYSGDFSDHGPAHLPFVPLKWFVGWDLWDHLRPIICAAANKKVIDGTLKTANVAAMADVVLPHISAVADLHAAVFPLPVLAFVVLVLRIGLNEYCKGGGPTEIPARPLVSPKPTRTRRRTKTEKP